MKGPEGPAGCHVSLPKIFVETQGIDSITRRQRENNRFTSGQFQKVSDGLRPGGPGGSGWCCR